MRVQRGIDFAEMEGLWGSGRRFDRKKFDLSFGLKNGFRFHFDSETCLNCPFLNSVGNLEPKLKWFFRPKLKPKCFY